MPATHFTDPFQRLSWLDRRRWSRNARRVVRQFEADTLEDLRSLAGSGVALEWLSERSAVADPAAGQPNMRSLPLGLAGPVEFSAGGRRVVAGAVWAPAWESLVGAWRSAAVSLAGVGRYHRSWVLNFRIAASHGPQAGAVSDFVLLASRVRLVDQWGGSLIDMGTFGSPAAPASLA